MLFKNIYAAENEESVEGVLMEKIEKNNCRAMVEYYLKKVVVSWLRPVAA